jgi:hypothetical protein
MRATSTTVIMYVVSGKDAVLTRAEEELGQYCSRFQDPTQSKECWDTYW